ncbi:hypothetical protein E2C01_093740 [Portunus trituberculatus]|uniref:Uncharacterized protein n=1 Tax=Portunus trituberculatus TaxID=210409 RepID=A0A5B7JV97_PORTR|nr:hypothetical protein [Portunus trituberculatus]
MYLFRKRVNPLKIYHRDRNTRARGCLSPGLWCLMRVAGGSGVLVRCGMGGGVVDMPAKQRSGQVTLTSPGFLDLTDL